MKRSLRAARGAMVLIGLAGGAACLPALVAAQTPAPEQYRPGLGDLMMSTIQPRHIKLGLAGQAKNWRLAAFELGQMQEAFGRVAQTWPQWRSISIVDMVEVVKDPMAELQQAIRARDAAGFVTAYAKLTEACNSCHVGANRGMIVVVPPGATPYADQDFAPHDP